MFSQFLSVGCVDLEACLPHYLQCVINAFKKSIIFTFAQNVIDRAKIAVERIVEKVGFLGILACASVSIFKFIIYVIKSVLQFTRWQIIILFVVLDTKSSFRLGGNNMWSFPSPVLDILRCNVNRQSCHKNAHSENVCHNCF